jgi:predicted RNase H-like HicB family nuclease
MMSTHRFLVIVERAGRNYSAYSPDLPGCVATGKTQQEAETNMHAAVEMHVEGLREDRLPIPASRSNAAFILLDSKTEKPTRKKSVSRKTSVHRRNTK